MVACPVCSVEIPERNVNAHLDKCLRDQEHQQMRGVVSSSEKSRPGRKPVQKIVYHLLKVKDGILDLHFEGHINSRVRV